MIKLLKRGLVDDPRNMKDAAYASRYVPSTVTVAMLTWRPTKETEPSWVRLIQAGDNSRREEA